MDFQEVVLKMVKEKKSIREMAKELNISKSTLHRRITKIKGEIGLNLCCELNELFESNKKRNQFYKKEKVEEN